MTNEKTIQHVVMFEIFSYDTGTMVTNRWTTMDRKFMFD